MATQTQWPRSIPLRDYHYTHSQPQWSSSAAVCLRDPLLPTRTCVSCTRVKEECDCHTCSTCQEPVYTGVRHHCRRCWRAVCASCWSRKRHVNMSAPPVRVCDNCAIPRALAQICRPPHRGTLSWGLYVLRRAADMANACVNPTCRLLTYSAECRVCGLPTAPTKAHVWRSVRINKKTAGIVARIEAQERAARHEATLVYEKGGSEPEASFRAVFPRYEELDAFASITYTRDAQDILLSAVAASAAYAYDAAPSLTLALSDVQYARVLRIVRVTARYTILEAPGRVKLIAFPGTHNARTLKVNLRYGTVRRMQWSHVCGGVLSGGNVLHGGMSKVWEYSVHSGFVGEAEATLLPVEQLQEDVRQGYRLVFAGHSLGGAVAQLLALRLLRANPETMKDKLRCVTFGAPLVGNYQLAQYVEQCGWRSNFHHFVYKSDLIPRVMFVDQITWKMAEGLLQTAIAIPFLVQQWFTKNRQPATPTEEDSTVEDMKAEELANNVDMRIKQGEDLIEEGGVDLACEGNHSTHRAYACFGRYHFLTHCGGVYYSTDDSEKAFHCLKDGCGGKTNLSDHSMDSYSRALCLHLYSSCF